MQNVDEFKNSNQCVIVFFTFTQRTFLNIKLISMLIYCLKCNYWCQIEKNNFQKYLILARN